LQVCILSVFATNNCVFVDRTWIPFALVSQCSYSHLFTNRAACYYLHWNP